MSLLSDRILRRAGRLGLQRARVAIPSKTLKRACSFVAEPGTKPVALGVSQSKGKLTIPHYWAVILHDGRRAIRAEDGHLLVWYRNPRDDPRTRARSGREPVRFAERGRLNLSKEKFRNFVKRKEIIVSRSSAAVTGDPFFGNEPGEGMHGFVDEVNRIALEEIRKEMAEFIGPMSEKDKRVSVATARL